jgi:hypothetical protein
MNRAKISGFWISSPEIQIAVKDRALPGCAILGDEHPLETLSSGSKLTLFCGGCF